MVFLGGCHVGHLSQILVLLGVLVLHFYRSNFVVYFHLYQSSNCVKCRSDMTYTNASSLVKLHLLLVAGSASQQNRSSAKWQSLRDDVSTRNETDTAAAAAAAAAGDNDDDDDDDDSYERTGLSRARYLLHFGHLVNHLSHCFICIWKF